MDNNKEKAKEFTQICAAFCDTMHEKYSNLEDCGIMMIAVNATDNANVSRQTMVVGDSAALTYGLLKAVHDENSAVLELLKMTADIQKYGMVLDMLKNISNNNNGDMED